MAGSCRGSVAGSGYSRTEFGYGKMGGLRVGIASVDITPPAGLPMAGFAARTLGASGAHDPLRATAIVVDDTALLSLDLLGVGADLTSDISARCRSLGVSLTVVASHTHGGPISLGPGMDAAYRAQIVDKSVALLVATAAARQPARLLAGQGATPGVARNRRHADGPTDQSLPVLRFETQEGAPLAIVVAYACHPTVLGADNRFWTADWHGPLRARLEAALPGSIALTLTGCCADANVGHSAHASITLESSQARSFPAAEAAAEAIAKATLAARLEEVSGNGSATAQTSVSLGFVRRETISDEELGRSWKAEAEKASPARRALLEAWIEWANGNPARQVIGRSVDMPVSVMRWADFPIFCLPGEMFAQTAHELRLRTGRPDAIVLAYAGDNPGYIAPRSEYLHGGYEIDEAHRYYGQPASFAEGSAEQLVDAAVGLARDLQIIRSQT